jgi:basic membrane lipoprotein Med (substrate-binding protein (PBP1-ABC) superfamily)
MIIPFFTACNNSNSGDENGETTTTAAEETPSVHKVGFIYSGFVRNSTHNLIFEDSRIQLERNRGIETCYVENVFVSNFQEAVELLISRDVTIIISTSPGFANSAQNAAIANKDTIFFSFGGDKTLANLSVFKPCLYQASHIAGLAASFNTNSNSIGIVADASMFNHEGVINGYILGVTEYLDRSVQAHVNYVNSDNANDVQRAIDDLVNNQGVEIVMLYLSTDFGIRHCEARGIKVIAYSGNLPEIAPDNYITGFYFNVNSYLTEQVLFIQNDMFYPSRTYGGMNTGHVHLIDLNRTEGAVVSGTRSLTDELLKEVLKKDQVFMGQIIDNLGVTQVEYGYTLNTEQIFDIRWLVHAVGHRIVLMSEPLSQIPFTPLVVRGEWEPDSRPDHAGTPFDPENPDEPALLTTAEETSTAEPDTTEAPSLLEPRVTDTTAETTAEADEVNDVDD